MNILFVCTGNSCRSPMAEGIAKTYSGDFEIFSAGIRPETHVSPFAVEVLSDTGVDISGHIPRHISGFLSVQHDVVVCFGSQAYEYCTQHFEQSIVKFFDVADPWGTTGSDHEVRLVYEKTRKDIERIIFLLFNEVLKSEENR